MIYLFGLYLLIALAVIFFSIKCANYVDLIDKKSHISGAFIGGIILAAVTSLPELITSLSSVFIVHNHELVIGNVLGSNLFNLAVFGGLVLGTVRFFKGCKISTSHMNTLICTAIIYISTMITIFFECGTIPVISINFTSIVIVVLYIMSFRFMAGDNGDSSEEHEDTSGSDLTMKQIIIRFVIMAILLVLASIAITYVTDIIAEELSLNASLAGALFLGVATSLPELTSSVTLVRKKNYDATIGNIIGSNIFNFLILVITDLIVFGDTAFVPSKQTNSLLVFGLIATLATLVILICKRIKSHAKVPKRVYAILSFLVLASYFLFLVFSM